ncbi:regulation of nuclear pre-mRNA domain-containing protein 1A isoform X2 [Amborella trichopoda]|nr:regulation of nuclear pre-mRNA domain-containing protein 1A isoform X2 [Amborella trichopoda]|eukprot:XP_011620697.1 regulation of nuclear pre-mRNA domain-containing protein 1A isoform X2 [Amborella trichopoda]
MTSDCDDRMNNVFNNQILAEKLSKLNNSQQSIETLSHWCIFHRKKAKQVVETWEKLFNSSQKEQRIAFLYLANDILQNSRRKGSEFVNEFWKVLPRALKDVLENNGEPGKKVVTRLMDIWEERKVFGSRARSLKAQMLGKDPPPLPENNGKSSNSNSIKIVKKDTNFLRIKLAVGGMPEKILSSFHSVHDDHVKEDNALNSCKASVHHMGKLEKDAETACSRGDPQGATLANELDEQESNLRQCIEVLKSIEANRASLIIQLKEALQEQESQLEQVRNQLKVAQAQIDQASRIRHRLATAHLTTSSDLSPPPTNPNPTPILNLTPPLSNSNTKSASIPEPPKKSAAELAAEMAAKLTASTSSAQIFSSVLSSLAAEEAASSQKSGSFFGQEGTPENWNESPLEKKPKLEKPMPVFTQITQQITQGLAFPQPHMQQYVQPSGGLMMGLAYSYGPGGPPLPPPPPLPVHAMMGPRSNGPVHGPGPGPATQQMMLPGFYSNPGTGFYMQGNNPPPVPR